MPDVARIGGVLSDYFGCQVGEHASRRAGPDAVGDGCLAVALQPILGGQLNNHGVQSAAPDIENTHVVDRKQDYFLG